MFRPSDDAFEEEIVRAAEHIGLSTAFEGLFEAQFTYYLAAQNIMRTSGYEEIRKRFPRMSEAVANALKGASVRQIKALCSSEISTLVQGVSDDVLMEMLNPKKVADNGARMIMQVLSKGMEELA